MNEILGHNNSQVEAGKTRAETEESGGTIQVDISDALCEQDKVKFTVQTRISERGAEEAKTCKTTRTHEDFLWLHSVIDENSDYAGLIIPPRPPKPDFQLSQERLDRMGEKEARGGRLEFAKVKQDLEADYLAAFKKTVAQHEAFLKRLASHPTLKKDCNLKIFLEYEQELGVRGKNVKEKLSEFFGLFQRSTDELLLASTQHDGDTFFVSEKIRLMDYHSRLRLTCIQADKMSSSHKALAANFSRVASGLAEVVMDAPGLASLAEVCEGLEKVKRIEGRLATDQELKLADTLRYHVRDTAAAKDLLYRRLRTLNKFEVSNKELHLARARNIERDLAESLQTEAWAALESLSETAKGELQLQKERRVESFQKNLRDLAELEVKHARAHCQVLRQVLGQLRSEE